MRSIVARAENPRASARAAQSTRSRPGAPGTVLGSPMPICIMGQNLRRLELFPLARSLDPFGRAPRGALRHVGGGYGLRDRLEGLAHGALGRVGVSHVAERQDADELAVLDHGQPADPVL